MIDLFLFDNASLKVPDLFQAGCVVCKTKAILLKCWLSCVGIMRPDNHGWSEAFPKTMWAFFYTVEQLFITNAGAIWRWKNSTYFSWHTWLRVIVATYHHGMNRIWWKQCTTLYIWIQLCYKSKHFNVIRTLTEFSLVALCLFLRF